MTNPAIETEGDPGIRVTVEDLKTGESETKELMNDYLIICTGNRYVHHVQAHIGGTHVITVKKEGS